ncbi:hypothetical protein [Shinella sp. M31]|uniref:hypothetical protein n=1 Tax=Shinella sp. M31 TaxID=3368615 RepID=UPI003BA21D94
MPIILDPAVFDTWLDPATPVKDLIGILGHHLNAQMRMRRVSREVKKATLQGRAEPIVNSL